MNKQLSATKKIEYLPLLYNKQKGKCLYCKQTFESFHDAVIDHLNDNRRDNRFENLGLAHQSCNIKKSTYLEYKMIAIEQLKQNEDQVLSERNNLEDKSTLDASNEIGINMTNNEITDQFLMEKINTDGSILFSEALDSLVYLCQKKTSHGSHQAIRGYLKALTSPIGPYMIIKDEKTKKKLVVKRSGT